MIAPLSELEDAQLMDDLSRGNESALNALMLRWSPRLSAYLQRRCPDTSTAEDLLQETFVRVYQKRHSYNSGRSFSTWIYTIATNLSRNHVRWQKRHPVTLLDHSSLDLTSLSTDQQDPAVALEGKERAFAVRNAILGLPEDLRETLLLSTYEHLPHAQIATILGISQKAVEMRLYRARLTLRDSLSQWLSGT